MAIKKVLDQGKFKYEVIVKIRNKAGIQVMRRKRWFSSEREARKAEHSLLMELEGEKSKITWQAWVDHVLEKYRLQYRNSTYLNYKHCLNRWFTPIWKDRFIDEIKQSDVHAILFESGVELSSQTRRTHLKVVKRTFNVALEEGLITRNPAIGIRLRTEQANQAVLNRNEVELLLKAARNEGHRFYPHWMLALLTGMRSGELYSLRWKDVDLVTGNISVSRSWTRRDGDGPTKSAKARVCPISSECRKFLESLKERTSDPQSHVLPRLWEWDQGYQAKILRRFCRELGITEVKFHDLRATFITQMLSGGVSLAKVMAIVGHQSLQTTQGYLRMSGKDLEGATDSLPFEVPDAESRENVVSLFGR